MYKEKVFLLVLTFMLVALVSCDETDTNKSADAQSPAKLEQYILTPPPPAEPRINWPKMFGVRPGSPIFIKIPASGEKPLTYKSINLPLPSGIRINKETTKGGMP